MQQDRGTGGWLARSGYVPVRASDPRICAVQPAPGAPCGRGRGVVVHFLPRHLGLDARYRRGPERRHAGGGGPEPGRAVDRRQRAPAMLALEKRLDRCSGEHRATGLDIQVTCTPASQPGSRAPSPSGSTPPPLGLRPAGRTRGRPAARADARSRHMAGRGYTGTGMIALGRKPTGRPPSKTDNTWNRPIGKIRCTVEPTIANLTTLRALHADHHAPPTPSKTPRQQPSESHPPAPHE